jgi:DNA adenine methylase
LTTSLRPIPHLVPYQGSKRRLAPAILATLGTRRFERMIEPFCGSAALTLAAAQRDLADVFVLSDGYAPLVALWRLAIDAPETLAAGYEAIWRAQHDDPAHHYLAERARFHDDPAPARLLYLLARAVKNAPRWGRDGRFNQSPDHRRSGVHPDKVAAAARQVSALLQTRSEVRCGDFREVVSSARNGDFVYLDPPYVGTSQGRDRRYASGLQTHELEAALLALQQKRVAIVVSYDGRTGERVYAPPLSPSLGLRHLELPAGRSSQATLLGRQELTFESLYVGGALLDDPAADPDRRAQYRTLS